MLSNEKKRIFTPKLKPNGIKRFHKQYNDENNKDT